MIKTKKKIDLDEKEEKKRVSNEEFIKKKGYDPYLIESVQPQGGINFRNDRFIVPGDGYEACIHIYDYPQYLDSFWLARITNKEDALTVIDIATEDITDVKKDINRSIKEQRVRFNTAKEISEQRDAEQRYHELEEMYDEIQRMGQVVKLICIRMYVSAKTMHEIDEKAKNVMTELASDSFKACIFMNETKEEWQAMYIPYSKQQELKNKRYGQPVLSETLSGGNPFHFTSLNDNAGTYLGTTDSTNGAVLFDQFEKTEIRLSYNAVVVGKMGSGKSTLLKKLLEDNAIRGNFIRGFDPTGEFEPLVNALGGKIISLDGGDGILNALEILRTTEDDYTNFTRHISKLQTMYKFLVPTADQQEVIQFEKLVRLLYMEFNIMDEEGRAKQGKITGLASTSYPIFSDLLRLIDKEIRKKKIYVDDVETEISKIEIHRMSNIRNVIENLCTNFKNVFDGYTTIENIVDTQIVYFNIVNLANMKSEVFDAQIFNALSLCWDNCVKVGMPMKYKWDNKKIEWDDITRFLIIFDESHKVINANKTTAVEQLILFSREARKFFGGLIFASQNIRDYIPEGSSSDAVEMIKTLFELTQYKFVFQQDVSSIPILNQVFHEQLTETELNKIPKLGKGQCVLSLSNTESLSVNIAVTEKELELFAGGA